MEYTINGRRLSVDVHGAGEPLLLIHGLGGTANAWAPVVAAFASTMQVIVPDLPGAGRSAPVSEVSIASLATDSITADAMRQFDADTLASQALTLTPTP